MRRSMLHVTPEGRAACAALGVTTADALLALEGGSPVAASRTRSTVRLDTPDGALYLKRYTVLTWRHLWRGLLRWTLLGPSKARREWRNADRLRALGWEVPERLALAEVRRLCALRGCAVLTRAMDDAERLDACLWRLRERGAAGRVERTSLIEGLALALRRLHVGGYVDRNMHPRNILVRWDGATPSFVKLDSPRGRRLPWRRAATCARDLAALDAVAAHTLSRADRRRFLRAYLGPDALRRRVRSLVRAITRERNRCRRREEPRAAEAREHVAA